MLPGQLPPKVLQTLNQLALDLIQMEQYLDFVRNRMFRASLLCREEAPLVRQINVDLMQDLHLSSPVVRWETGKAAADGEAVFRLESGGTVTLRGELAAAALDELSRAWPASLPFEGLFGALARAGRVEDSAEGRHQLASLLMHLHGVSAVSASVAPARSVPLSRTPVVMRAARLLSATEGWVPTPRHTVCQVDDVGRKTAPLMDGTHDRAALLRALMQEHRAGRLPVRHKGALVRDAARAEEMIGQGLDQCLQALARMGAFMG
jgi:hypothetical protein